MHAAVDASAGDPKGTRYTRTAHCIIVFVAVDDQGTPVEAKRWHPQTEEDVALEQYTKGLMELRGRLAEEAVSLPKSS